MGCAGCLEESRSGRPESAYRGDVLARLAVREGLVLRTGESAPVRRAPGYQEQGQDDECLRHVRLKVVRIIQTTFPDLRVEQSATRNMVRMMSAFVMYD